jgi:hypothetical protein
MPELPEVLSRRMPTTAEGVAAGLSHRGVKGAR